MSERHVAQHASRRSAGALALCGVLGVVIGMMAGLNIARRLAPPATESRLVMQLLEAELEALRAEGTAGECTKTSTERMRLLHALIDQVPVSMRDTLVVDAEFESQVRRLREAVTPFAGIRDCPARRKALARIDTTCRDCHRQFRSGG